MSSERELKKQLKRRAEIEIERILANRKPAGENSLRDIERLAIQAGQGFREQVLSYLAEEESQAREEPVCEDCGRRMKSRGRRKRDVVTEAGEVTLERRYYVCPKCGKKAFPLDERWGLAESVYSSECARQMVWLSGLLTYEEASQVFERIGHRLIPSASIWRQTQTYGVRTEAEVRRQEQQVSIERVVSASRRNETIGRKGVSMDGGMVNIRGEGWKEFKTGTVYDIERHWERDPKTRELVQVPHGVHIGYTAVLGGPPDFSPAASRLAVEHGLPDADDSSVTSDGAEWIWNLTVDLFPDSVQIVDGCHACQHLAEASRALFPDQPEQAQRWYSQAQTTLFQSGAWAIAAQLEAANLPDHAHYSHAHQRRMQYQEFHELGYPIGSGTVESGINPGTGVKQFKARLSGPGMRWLRPAAQQMLIIRAAVLDHSFDTLWLNVA